LFLDEIHATPEAIPALRYLFEDRSEIAVLAAGSLLEFVLAEQFIGQHLIDMLSSLPNRELTYWLRQGRSNNAEIDYVIALDGQIVPIEVKAGATGRASLHTHAGHKRVDYRLISLPMYLVERLPEFALM